MHSFGRSLCALSLLTAFGFITGCDSDDTTTEPGPQPQQHATTFEVTIENVSGSYVLLESGAVAVPVGASDPGPLFPGDSYEVTFHAGPGTKLSFALMMVQSNDLFYAPAEEGIALFDEEGAALGGDVTDRIMLWDAGTELNQEPGLGPDQAPRQAGPNSGEADPDGTVRLASDDFGNLPDVGDVLQATLTPGEGNMFTLTLTNVSSETTLPTSDGGSVAVPLAPVAFALHGDPGPLFSEGMPDRGEGLETLAEDGDPGMLLTSLEPRTGLASPLAPGVFAVHPSGEVLFVDGEGAAAGLEALAEDGDPSLLAMTLANDERVGESGTYAVPEGQSEPGPLLPGGSYRFTFDALPGDHLSFATMLVQSNDFFFAPDAGGIALFDADGAPLSGDVTSAVSLWNAGTEVDQAPGAGPDQAPRQAGPDSGTDEGGSVGMVTDPAWPGVDQVIKVTIVAK